MKKILKSHKDKYKNFKILYFNKLNSNHKIKIKFKNSSLKWDKTLEEYKNILHLKILLNINLCI
jgi:hypothetical protein